MKAMVSALLMPRAMSTGQKPHRLSVAVMLMCCLVSASVSAGLSGDADSKAHRFHADNILGTSFVMTVRAPQLQAKAARDAVFAEIDRLQQVLSHYDKRTEISRVNQADGRFNPSAELIAVVSLCEQWRHALPRGFSCRMGQVVDRWQVYQQQQQTPQRKTIRDLARRAATSDYSIDDFKAGTSNDDFNWRLDGLAKGYILDRAMQVAKKTASSASAIAIDIGGDGVYWQASQQVPWQVGLANPLAMDDRGQNRLGLLRIDNGAVAYSGHNSRTVDIVGRRYSHILVPRDGWPTTYPVTAIVYADTAVKADALATAFAAMEVADVMAWLAHHKEVAALLILPSGRQVASPNWFERFSPAESNGARVTVSGDIRFELPRIHVANARRPYVALWIQNDERKVVKHLLLLGDSDQWMRENRLWWRLAGRRDDSLLAGFARPTRRAGQYDLHWNGLDDYGKPLSAGDYALVLEVSREHGGREVLRIPFTPSRALNLTKKKGKTEIGFLTFQLTQE